MGEKREKENLSKEIEDVKKNQIEILELKNTIGKAKKLIALAQK